MRQQIPKPMNIKTFFQVLVLDLLKSTNSCSLLISFLVFIKNYPFRMLVRFFCSSVI